MLAPLPSVVREYHIIRRSSQAVITFIAYLCGLLLIGCNSTPTANTPKTLNDYAYVISTNYIKDYLSSPSTASFDYFTAEPDITLVNGRYTVKYHFSATDAFGAKVQSNFICDLRFKGGAPETKTNWDLLALQIEGQTVAGSFAVAEQSVAANSSVKTATKTNIGKYYHVDKTSGNGYYLKVYVYLADKSKIQDVNDAICQQYAGKYSQVISIWYLDKKNFADTYINAIDDKNISDAAFNKMDKHLIGTFEQQVGQTASIEMNQ